MYGHLARAIGTQPPDEPRAAETLEALAALEIACYQEFVGGVRGSAITFTRISAANRTPLADRFEKLRDGNEPTWQRPVGAPPFATGIHPSRKLAGNELNNFAAFVKPEWRANDWMWGRLDAVPTLVDILVTPESIAGALQREGIDELVPACQWLHDIIATPPDDDDGAWQEFLTTEVWEPMSNRIGDELEAILAQAAGSGVDAIRDAFVARRQWEILAEELALPTTPAGTASPTLSPDDTSTRVAQHRVGVQTLTEPRHRDNVDLFQDLSRAAGQALVGNVEAVRDRRGRSGSKPDRVDEVTRIAGATVQRVGGIASSLWLAPASTLVSWRRLGSILAAIAVIGAVVWAFLSDWKVALIALVGGIAVTLFLLGGFVVLRRPAKRSPAAGET
jgi:hypothetical protein